MDKSTETPLYNPHAQPEVFLQPDMPRILNMPNPELPNFQRVIATILGYGFLLTIDDVKSIAGHYGYHEPSAYQLMRGNPMRRALAREHDVELVAYKFHGMLVFRDGLSAVSQVETDQTHQHIIEQRRAYAQRRFAQDTTKNTQ